MLEEMKEIIVPANVNGKQNELSKSRKYDDLIEAHDAFKRACKRLLNPKVWHELEGALSPVVSLVDETGDIQHRLAEVGDYYRIQLPALSNAEGEGYDWVIVDEIREHIQIDAAEESFGLRLRATAHPKKGGDTAHFFKGGATSSFIVHRHHTTVSVYYFGRNEVPNESTDSIAGNIRNAIIATAAFIGMSELQWNTLLKSLLEEEIGA